MTRVLDPATIEAQLGAIKERYPGTWYTDPVARAEATRLWGGGCNKHGVFLDAHPRAGSLLGKGAAG